MARLVVALVLVLSCGRLAEAQDRLFVGTREVGSFGHFNEDLGAAPWWAHHPRFGGDRYVHVRGAGVVDLLTGSPVPLGEGWVVAYHRARPHVVIAREGGVWQEDVRTAWAVLVLPRLEGLVGCVNATSAYDLVGVPRQQPGVVSCGSVSLATAPGAPAMCGPWSRAAPCS